MQSRLRGLPLMARSRACKLDFSEALRPSRTSWIRAQNQVFFKFLVTHRLDKLSLTPFFKLSSSRQAAPPHKTMATARSAGLDVQILWVIKWRVCDRSTSNRNTHRDCDKIGSIGGFSHFPRSLFGSPFLVKTSFSHHDLRRQPNHILLNELCGIRVPE